VEQGQHLIQTDIPEKPTRRSKRIIIGIFTTLIIVGLIAGVLWLVRLERAASAPLRTSDAFVNSLLDKRPQEAYALTNEDFKAQTSQDVLGDVSDTISKGLKLETLKVSRGEIEDVERGKLATVYYEIEGKDAKYQLTIRLLKEKDKGWLVVSADNEVKQ